MLTQFIRCTNRRIAIAALIIIAAVVIVLQPWALFLSASGQETSNSAASRTIDLRLQTKEQANIKSVGCIQCHQNTGDPHEKGTVNLGCIDCHGGNANTNVK